MVEKARSRTKLVKDLNLFKTEKDLEEIME